MKQTNHESRRHGFRISFWDVLILALAAGLTAGLLAIRFPLAWMVPVVVGHFFLFCNVFLVWRRLEMIWAMLFICNFAIHVACGQLGWFWPLICQLPATVFVIARQIRSPWYHGIFAERLNPRLNEYINGALSKKEV